MTRTLVPSLTRDVSPARKLMSVRGSRYPLVQSLANLPVVAYGYGVVWVVGMTTWSVTKMDEYRRSSALRASLTRTSGVASGPRPGRAKPKCMAGQFCSPTGTLSRRGGSRLRANMSDLGASDSSQFEEIWANFPFEPGLTGCARKC